MSPSIQALTAVDMVDLWERGATLSAPGRALVLLRHALSGTSVADPGDLPVADCDRLLLDLRRCTFGRMLPCIANCPACAEALEFELDCDVLRAAEATPAHQEARVAVRADGLDLLVRQPRLADMLHVAGCGDRAEAQRALLSRCIVAGNDGLAALPDALSPAAVAAIEHALLATEPHAETLLDLQCPDCRHGWQSPCDIAAFLWAEVAARARRLLQEVHVLARVYGWREGEILALSPRRRAAYLDMVTA